VVDFGIPGGLAYLTTRKHPWVLTPTSWLFQTSIVTQANMNSFGDWGGIRSSRVSGFLFRINPVRAEFSQSKMRTLELVKSGYQNIYWYNKSLMINLSGTTGAFGPIPAGGIFFDLQALNQLSLFGDPLVGFRKSGGSFDITRSEAWASFQKLRQVFLAQTSELYALFTDDSYTYFGSVQDFQFGQDANDPFQIKYSFMMESFAWSRINQKMVSTSIGQDSLRFSMDFRPIPIETAPGSLFYHYRNYESGQPS